MKKVLNKNFMPVLLDVSQAKILIVGGDQGALKKLRLLRRFTNNIEVLAIYVCDEIKKSGVKYYEKAYDKEDLNNYLMVYSCTNDYQLDVKITEEAREKGVLVNIHDRPELCQFVSPAIYKRNNITVSVGSNGEDVYESIRIRDFIKNYLDEFYFSLKKQLIHEPGI